MSLMVRVLIPLKSGVPETAMRLPWPVPCARLNPFEIGGGLKLSGSLEEAKKHLS